MPLLTNLVKKRIDIPGHDGEWVEIRKVGWRKLREAAEEQQRKAFGYVKALGKEGMEMVANVSADQIKAAQANPAVQFDTGMLLRSGIVSWSLSAKVTPDEIDELDESIVEWLAGEIVTLSRPPRDEAAEKND